MTIWGLHVIDIIIVIIFLFVLLWIGRQTSKQNKSADDFFLAGRKLNKFYQFFLNFGCSTNADQAVAVTREIYRQGIGGMWIQFLVLFLTPFYWFSTFFFRRVRLITIGDYFTERFRSRFLGGAYAVFYLMMSFLGGGVGYLVAAKTLMAMTPKPESEYSISEKRSVENYRDFRSLSAMSKAEITTGQTERLTELQQLNKKGELSSFVSYVEPLWFYLIYALVVGLYTMMGGFRAAVITDTIQGVLIIIFSVILIPAGLIKAGGFTGLHTLVPDYMFELFGSPVMSEYAWYTILGMVLANLVSIIAVSTGMSTAGSAKDEMTARLGMITGMFTKRLMMIMWALAGLLAIALYAGQISDPDLIWGYMTQKLLFPGAIGLMLVGILAANMSTLDATSVSYSALFIRNLYEPFYPGKSEKHYLLIGKLVIPVTLAGGIVVALYVDNLLELFKYIISVPAIFGAALWLGFIWRKLTRWAVIIQVLLCFTIYAVLPNLLLQFDSITGNQKLIAETSPKEVIVRTGAMASDVESGIAEKVGQVIEKKHTIAPVGIFFENVARINPDDPASPKGGFGRFHAEIWIMSWFGIEFSEWTKPQLTAARFFFDALFPFILLFLISFITKPVDKSHLDRFYAKMYTPVQPTPDEDRLALEASYADPGKFNNRKLGGKFGWEMLKPKKIDYIGFLGSWVLVGIIILLLWLVVSIGR